VQGGLTVLEVIQSVAALILTLSILVTFHEFGHYWVARLCNVHVLRFSVGFGKPLYSKRGPAPAEVPVPEGQVIETRSNEKLEGTEFAVAAIPLGGYVKMLDEREGFVPDDQKHLAFNRKPVWQRIAIVAAGPIANFLLAIVAYWLLFASGISGIAPILGELSDESLASKAGLKAGQEIVAVDGERTQTWADVNLELFNRLGDSGEITLTILEPGTTGLSSSSQLDAQSASRSGFSGIEYRIPVDNWLRGVDEPRPASALGLRLQYPVIPAVLGLLLEDKPAIRSGLQVNDRIVAIDGIEVVDWPHWVEMVQASPEQPLDMTVVRTLKDEQVQTLNITVTPERREFEGKVTGYVGAGVAGVEFPPEMQRIVSYPFYSAWIPAVKKTWSLTTFTLGSIGKMITGDISTKNLSGPITIAQVANATAKSGIEQFVRFIALLSVSLGVLNLLPIPVLDGGHLLYYLVELVTRRPVPEKVQVWGLQMGMFFIVSIMMLAFYNDLMRLW
jgi:regulator of sigma E protease